MDHIDWGQDPIEFIYDDTDEYQHEISEIYSYSEESEFFANRNAFEESMEDCGLPLTWKHMVSDQKSRAINYMMTALEVSCRTTRIKSCRSLAYLIQGNFGECLDIDEQKSNSQDNVFTLYQQGIFQAFVQQLIIESNLNAKDRQNQAAPMSTQIYNDSAELRLILSVLCTITETMYHNKNSTDLKILETRQQFITELQNPIGDELLSVMLFQMLNSFCGGQAPHYPVRKITLLLWKIILITLGGTDDLKAAKERHRKQCKLDPTPDDTMDVMKNMYPCAPLMITDEQARARNALLKSMMVKKERNIFKQHLMTKQPAMDDPFFEIAREARRGAGLLDSLARLNQSDDEIHWQPMKDDSSCNNDENASNDADSGNDLNDSMHDTLNETQPSGSDTDTTDPGEDLVDSGNQDERDHDDMPWMKDDDPEHWNGPSIEIKDRVPFSQKENKFKRAHKIEVPGQKSETHISDLIESFKSDFCHDYEGTNPEDERPTHMLDDSADEIAEVDSSDDFRDLMPGRNEDRKNDDEDDDDDDDNDDGDAGEMVAQSHKNEHLDQDIGRSDLNGSYKGLPWTPKIRKADLIQHLSNIRQKFLGYTLPNDLETTFGLPDPIIEGINVLRKHLYVSLGEVQLEREETMDKYPLTHGELNSGYRDEPAEKLYAALLPRLPQYMIALLKILLAASTNSKSKPERSESINIMVEINPDVSAQSILQITVMNADANRHKEIIIKAISAILILLLKHFKINHAYQFEYVSQQLMFANCIPLILKFLSQDIFAYMVSSRSTIGTIEFPARVIGEQPESLADAIQTWESTHQPYCWRNMFSCINLVRVLNKLTKWKHSRIMMLVVFKSSQTLLKALNVRHSMFQVFILKLLKVQLKFLGRQWKKSNMKLISPIYQKVRHRLTDDWAYSNDNEARPWDFQAEEFTLQANINKFHQRRYNDVMAPATGKRRASCMVTELDKFCGGLDDYGGGGGLFTEADCDFGSMDMIRVSPNFERNYERWLESEVFQRKIDWDNLLAD